MEYLDYEKKLIKEYWDNYYITRCEKCNEQGYINDHICICKITANASYYCEINGFGREYLKRQILPGKLKDDIYNYYLNNSFDSYVSPPGIYLCGRYNTGKTVAITSLAKNIIIKYNPLLLTDFNIKFFLYDDLVRISLEDNIFLSKLEPIIKKTDILVLDNIGGERGLNTTARSSVALLDNILRNREIMGKQTWITSNILYKEIKTVYSEPIYNIINRNCEVWVAS